MLLVKVYMKKLKIWDVLCYRLFMEVINCMGFRVFDICYRFDDIIGGKRYWVYEYVVCYND